MTTAGLILALKLALAPALISLASLAGRRWGPAVSGWFIGLPLTTGPVALILAVQEGPAYAAAAAVGTLAGGLTLVVYALAYSWLAQKWRWPGAVAGSAVVVGATTAVLRGVTLTAPQWLALVTVAAAVAITRLPAARVGGPAAAAAPWWDLPSRIVIATGVILTLTGLAPWLGAALTGLLATFPIYTTILAAFAQHQQGVAAAVRLQRGAVAGVFALEAFFFTLHLGLVPLGIGPAFALALAVAAPIQGLALILLRRQAV